jgi:TonB-dependent receptor
MPTQPLNRTLIAIAVAQIFSATAVAADDATSAPIDPAAPIQSVTIATQRTAQAIARAEQEDAPNLVNVISADDIGKLPDVNAGEAVRRLPGISLETDTGEGRFVNIRGLDADLTSTTLGGVRLPPSNTASPFGGGRAVAFDTIPAGMIGSITVTKSNKPEQDAEALGGTIDITPKALPPSGHAFLEGKIGAGSELLRHSGVTDLSVSGGTRFGLGSGNSNSGPTAYADKPFSFVGSYSRYEDRRGVDDLEAGYAIDGGTTTDPKAYSGLEQRYYNYHRTRYGAGGELAYEPDAANKWYVRYYDSGYTEAVNRQTLIANFAGSATRSAAGTFTESDLTFDKTLRDERETISSQVFTIGGKHTLDGAKLDYHVAHTAGSDNRPYDANTKFSNPTGATVTYNNIADPNYPQLTVTGLNPNDPNGYLMSRFNNSSVRAKTSEWSGAANLAMPTHLTSAEDEALKLGVSARARKNENLVTPYSYTAIPGATLSQAITGDPVSYYEGHYQNGYSISNDFMRNLYAQGAGFVENTASDALSAARQSTHNTEDVLAAYVQQQMTFGKLGLLAGVRLEHTRARYDGNALAGGTVSPVENANSYTNLFPSLQARYELAPKSIVRASFSSTIARPGFNQTSASTTIDVGNNIVTTGNPALKPTLSNNFDLAFEHYLPHAGIVSLGLFDKALKDYIVGKVDFQNFPNSGAYAGLAGNTKVITFGNVSSARARGLEANYEQRFTSLPGILSGLGAGFNWTYVDSSVEIRPGEHSMLPSTSRNTYNGSVFWERDGLNLRLSTYYTGRNLLGIGGDVTQDIYSEPRRSADFGASYQIAKNYGLFLNVKNLTNTAMKFTEGTIDRVIQREFYGKTVEAGINFAL